MDQIDVSWDVTPVAQTETMSCWAAAAAMLLSHKSAIPTTELQACQQAGDMYVAAFQANTGLAGTAVGDFAQALSCVAEAPQNFMPAGYAALLQAHGPVWIGTAILYPTIYRHVRILRALFGDGTFDGTTATLVDPDGGREYQQTVTELAKELEEIAREDLADGSDLNPQVIRLP